jgi:3-hydroxybutyryl-CoA dehydrogenase
MGAAIAQTLAVAGCAVTLTDISTSQLDEARRLIEEGRFGLRRAQTRGKLTETAAATARSRLSLTAHLEDAVEGSAVVIEAIPEVLVVKLRLFRELGKLTGPDVILASNTSGFPVVALAEVAQREERTIGWHWASPAQIRPLAELVRTDQTSDEAIEAIVALASRCGKNPIVITENPQQWGFVANRILMAAIREANQIASEGLATVSQIDQLVCDAYGWPAGPLSVLAGASEGWGDGREGSVHNLGR